ncbi:MAG TPA: NAD-dependent epimerase/dehydratase family protein, partial [Pirellulales bacterium]
QAFRNADLHADSDGPALSGVIHLAGRAGVRTSVENPWIYYETNVVGTLNLLECCRMLQVPKFVLASTSSVYGGSTTYPFCETMTTDQPLSPYAASKKAAETLIHSYHHLHGIDATCLRYFTVYGPAGRPDMSVFRFIRAIAEGETITVYGDGLQERDFTYVDDIARGTIAALKPVGCEAVNLGGDRPVSVATLIKRIENRLGKTANIRYSPAHPADGRKTWAKIDKAKQLFDWSPEVSIEDGLDRTVEWYLDHRDFASQIDVRENVLTNSKAA